jgi:shikimate kinase
VTNFRHIALVGFMGSGKTSVGYLLAQALHYPFFDTDRVIETHEGTSVAHLFATAGEAAFRQLEYRVLTTLLHTPPAAVIACGGGAPCVADAMAQLAGHAITVYLHTPPAVLYQRLQAEAAQRPLLHNTENLPAYIASLLAQRAPVYEKAAYTVATEGKTVAEVCEEIKNILPQQP